MHRNTSIDKAAEHILKVLGNVPAAQPRTPKRTATAGKGIVNDIATLLEIPFRLAEVGGEKAIAAMTAIK